MQEYSYHETQCIGTAKSKLVFSFFVNMYHKKTKVKDVAVS